jgi:hypothetical protein
MRTQNKKEKKNFSKFDNTSQKPIKGKEFNIKDTKKISGGTSRASACQKCQHAPCTCH